MGRSIASGGGRSEGAWGRAESPLLASIGDNFAEEIPPGGADAPTPAREKGLQPYGALTLFFRWRKKSVQKKASGTATTGKSPLLPILTAGLAMSRAAELASLRLPSCALGARLFPPSKWAGLFPSAAYRRSAPPQSAVGRLTPCKLGCFDVAGRFCSVDEQADFLFPRWRGAGLPLAGWEASMWHECFLPRKRPAGFQIHAGLFKRAMRPVAEWRSLLYNRQGAIPDRRAARPVAERR